MLIKAHPGRYILRGSDWLRSLQAAQVSGQQLDAVLEAQAVDQLACGADDEAAARGDADASQGGGLLIGRRGRAGEGQAVQDERRGVVDADIIGVLALALRAVGQLGAYEAAAD